MSRQIQITALKQKIERLQAQLDYLLKIEELEARQDKQVQTKTDSTQNQ